MSPTHFVFPTAEAMDAGMAHHAQTDFDLSLRLAASERALLKAAQDFVWTVLRDCQHDFEGHDLQAVERYMVRRWTRAKP